MYLLKIKTDGVSKCVYRVISAEGEPPSPGTLLDQSSWKIRFLSRFTRHVL